MAFEFKLHTAFEPAQTYLLYRRHRSRRTCRSVWLRKNRVFEQFKSVIPKRLRARSIVCRFNSPTRPKPVCEITGGGGCILTQVLGYLPICDRPFYGIFSYATQCLYTHRSKRDMVFPRRGNAYTRSTSRTYVYTLYCIMYYYNILCSSVYYRYTHARAALGIHALCSETGRAHDV